MSFLFLFLCMQPLSFSLDTWVSSSLLWFPATLWWSVLMWTLFIYGVGFLSGFFQPRLSCSSIWRIVWKHDRHFLEILFSTQRISIHISSWSLKITFTGISDYPPCVKSRSKQTTATTIQVCHSTLYIYLSFHFIVMILTFIFLLRHWAVWR